MLLRRPLAGHVAAGWLFSLLVLVLVLWPGLPARAQPAAAAVASVQLDDLTWTELRALVAAGTTTVLLPAGGTEQSGPHMALGKHNVRVQALAGLIARGLGQALVAPVLAYVPEGSIEPPTAHMRFAGTVSVPEPVFEAVLESAVRSFRRHGFQEVVLLGDHGGYQASLQRVAAKLNREWGGAVRSGPRVLALVAYYRAASSGHAELLAQRGFGAAEIGSHAGLADTALSLAVDPALVRLPLLQRVPKYSAADGVVGDPSRASAALGQIGVDHIVAASIAAIRSARRSP